MEYLSEEEVNELLRAMEPATEKAINKAVKLRNMGPVRRKLHRLRCSFGRFVYDQKTKFRYNVALKRGKPMEDALTAEEIQQLMAAMRLETTEHERER